MEELSVRVLAHVPTPQLHESYNAVLHEEFASVSQTLGDVVAAFAKLQEVHDAVSKLQQSHDPSTDRRNNSARALADNSMVLQQQLQCQVEKLAAGMEVVPVERKRKRVDDDGRPAATVTKREGAESSPASESGSDDSDENSDVVEGSEAAWKALTATSGASLHEVKSEPCSARPEADTSPPAEVLKDSATHLLPIMRVVDKLSEVDQSFIIPEVLTVLIESVEEDVDATQQSEVMRSLKIVVEWLFHRRKFQLQYAELYHKYARVVESYADRLPIPEEQSKLKRLTKMLTSKIKTRGKIVSGDKPAGIIAAIQDAKEKKACSKVLSFQDTLLYRNRIKVPLHVLIALKKETADGGSKSFEDRLIKVFSKLFRWFSADVREPVQLLLYRMFLIAIRELVNQTRELSASVRVVELLEEMSEVVSDSSNSKRLANLRNRATEIGEEANRYQTQLIPPMVASKLTDAVRGLATEMVMGWKPYADATMRNCVKELKAVLLQAEASSEAGMADVTSTDSDRQHKSTFSGTLTCELAPKVVATQLTQIRPTITTRLLMEELFGRVLSHVPTPQLHESYNAVVHEDFASVSQTLDDVVAAFAKLQEVRDAVSKLQQSHEPSTDRRSDSVRTLADNSMIFQQQLQCQVEKLAAGMKVAHVERKSVGTDPPVRNSGGDVNEKEERGVASSVKGASGSESSSSSESESDGDEDGSDENSDEAEVASKVSAAGELSTSFEAKSEATPANDAGRLEADTHIATISLKKSATHMKVIIEMVNTFSTLNRSFIIPEVLAALKRSVEEDVGGMQQSEVTASLKVVLSWGDRRKGYQVQHVESYRQYAAVVESYAKRLPSSARSSELERLKDALCCMIKILEGCLTSGSEKADILAAVQDARKKYLFSQRMAVADTMPSEKRIETLLRMLIAFKKETTANVSCAFGGRMIKVIIKASRWLSEDVHDPVQSLVHRIIVDAFREFSSHIPTVLTRDRVVRLLDNMSEGISDPSNPRTRAQLTGLRNRATQAFKELKQYQRKPMSPREAHELTEAVRNLVEDVTVGWAPHRDVLVRKCVQELKNVLVQAQTSVDIKKSRSSFQVCLSKIVKWKVENPSVALEEERKRKRVDEEASMVPIVVTPARSKDGAEVMNDGAAKKAKRLEDGIGPDSDSSERDMKTASVVTQEVAAASSSDSSSSSETESDDSEDESDENGEEGSEAAWKALTTTGAGNSVKQSTGKLETQGEAEGTMTPDIVVDNSVIYMKTIVEDVNSMSPTERSFIIPDVLAALKKSVEEDINGMHPNEVASSLNILVGWWAGQCEIKLSTLNCIASSLLW